MFQAIKKLNTDRESDCRYFNAKYQRMLQRKAIYAFKVYNHRKQRYKHVARAIG